MHEMTIPDFKNKIDFFMDALYQKGYDSGWTAVVEELELRADAEWNMGNGATSSVIRQVANDLRGKNAD
jgi:hypothetical protein